MFCILWNTSSSVIITFAILIVFVVAVNAIGFILFDEGQGSGLVIVLDCVIYIVAVFMIANKNGGNLLDLTNDSSTVNKFLRIIVFCIAYGFINGLVEKNIYEENDRDMKTYLIKSSIKSYSINATVFMLLYCYLMQTVGVVFTGLFTL